MESSTPDPTGDTPEPTAVTPAAAPQPVPSLSLDETPAAAPSAPDLDAVTTEPASTGTEAQQANFDLWDSGSYATTLAQEGYGQPVPSAPAQPASEPPSAGYQQPAAPGYPPAGPYAQGAPYAQTAPYAQPPYQQPQPNPYAQSNPYAEPSPYAPVPYAPASAETLTPDQERTWASAAHWSALVATVVGLGFLGPLLVYLIQGPKSPWVKAQAAESLNFEITYIIAMIASFIATFIVVGLVTIFVFPVLWLVFRIIATVATSQGRDYRYPVNIRMVK